MKKENVVVKNKCHAKLDLASSTQVVNKQQQQTLKILNQVQDDKRRGFTLIELLVVVLIIGILAAVALPQYKKAVYKSRYATLKNLAKSIAVAQEVYYLANNRYAAYFEELDIDMPGGQLDSSIKRNYDYDWGYCMLEQRGQVFCTNLEINMQYQQHFLHAQEIVPQVALCIAFSTDTNDIRNQICKAETNRTINTGGGSSKGYFSYQYQD